MSLLAWQGALVELVGTGEVSPRRLAGLSPGEADWFRTSATAPGTVLTRAVAASWRAERVSRSTPLTLLALTALGLRDATLAAYVRETTSRSSYLVTEGLCFVDFVAGLGIDHPHLRAMVALDRSILVARATPWRPRPVRPGAMDDWIERAPGGALVVVDAEPRALLLALVSQAALPEPGSGEGAIIVGPGIDGRFREASPAEARIHAAAGGRPRAVAVSDVVAEPGDEQTVDGLVAVGVLLRRPSAPRRGPGGVRPRGTRFGCDGAVR